MLIVWVCFGFFIKRHSHFRNAAHWSRTAQTVDFSLSDSGMKLIGSDMPVKLRDIEHSSFYLLLYLTLSQYLQEIFQTSE